MNCYFIPQVFKKVMQFYLWTLYALMKVIFPEDMIIEFDE